MFVRRLVFSAWKFLERVQKYQKMNETLIQQLQGGHTKIKHPVPRKYTSNQERIKVIVQNYQKYKNDSEVFVYLRAISYCLKLRNVKCPQSSDEVASDENE